MGHVATLLFLHIIGFEQRLKELNDYEMQNNFKPLANKDLRKLHVKHMTTCPVLLFPYHKLEPIESVWADNDCCHFPDWHWSGCVCVAVVWSCWVVLNPDKSHLCSACFDMCNAGIDCAAEALLSSGERMIVRAVFSVLLKALVSEWVSLSHGDEKAENAHPTHFGYYWNMSFSAAFCFEHCALVLLKCLFLY